MYDPLTGRFLQEDPIDFAAGDPNLFRYVGNSPTNATDPSGLQPERPVAPLEKPLNPDNRIDKKYKGSLEEYLKDYYRSPGAHAEVKQKTYTGPFTVDIPNGPKGKIYAYTALEAGEIERIKMNPSDKVIALSAEESVRDIRNPGGNILIAYVGTQQEKITFIQTLHEYVKYKAVIGKVERERYWDYEYRFQTARKGEIYKSDESATRISLYLDSEPGTKEPVYGGSAIRWNDGVLMYDGPTTVASAVRRFFTDESKGTTFPYKHFKSGEGTLRSIEAGYIFDVYAVYGGKPIYHLQWGSTITVRYDEKLQKLQVDHPPIWVSDEKAKDFSEFDKWVSTLMLRHPDQTIISLPKKK